MDKKVEALSDLIDKINNKEILLPDFQRDFVWKEEERQAKLVESVIAKMPVGSILLLDSDAKDYAYKMIGCKERKTSKELGISGRILALLDGQQRVTVLTNAFSNVIFDTAKKSSNLSKRIGLQRRFFFRIPKYHKTDEQVYDFFNARALKFPLEDVEKTEPDFLSDEICEAIKVISFNATDDKCYNPFSTKEYAKSDLVNFCKAGKDYLIPLYLLTNSKNEVWLSNIINGIARNIELDILDEFEKLGEEEKEEYVKQKISKEILEFSDNPDKITNRDEFVKILEEQGQNWAVNMKSYLISCVNNIQLHKIIVDNHKRARAINIYQNLNEGGVALGTFELIMARFASESDENYYEKLKKNMRKKRNYPDAIYSVALEHNKEVKAKINSDEYVATIDMECFEKKENDVVSAYVDAYLDVLSLYSYASSFKSEDIRMDLIKKEKILSISPKDLREKCDDVCEAIDLALLFFKMRCGVRTIKGINYKLMLVVVAYILLNKKYRENRRTYDYLECWYWTSIFSGYFNSDQNERTITSIKKLIGTMENGDTKWIEELKEKMFKVDFYSERKFLLLERNKEAGITPKSFFRDVVCQYYLSVTYNGIISKDININPFVDEKLEKHHVIPLGSLTDPLQRISKSGEKYRKDDSYFLNSPFNFIYITDDENKAILNDKLSDYVKKIDDCAAKSILGFNGKIKADNEEECREELENRCDNFIGNLEQHINYLI